MDVLADVLSLAGVRGTVGARIEAGERWGWWATGIRGAAFHAVTSGTAWLAPRGQAPRELMPGDVVLLPRGTEHAFGADAERGGAHRPGQLERLRARRRRDGADRLGPDPHAHPLRALRVRPGGLDARSSRCCRTSSTSAPQHGGDGLDDTIRLLGRELAAPQLATSVVLDSLVDILLVQLLRAWLATEPAAALEPSWLGVLEGPDRRRGRDQAARGPGPRVDERLPGQRGRGLRRHARCAASPACWERRRART